MTLYRFKTEEEFIKEFGKEWKSIIFMQWSSCGDMDHLLGWMPSIINQEMINDLMKSSTKKSRCCGLEPSLIMKINHNIMVWTYSTDMFTPVLKNKQLEFKF